MFVLLETAMIGVFMALDFFLFYVFWEVMLLPMYFLIGIWGEPAKVRGHQVHSVHAVRQRADADRHPRAGLLPQRDHGRTSFDLMKLEALTLPPTLQFWGFLAFALAFAIKVPSSRCTRGCPTRTSRPRRQVPSSSRACS